MATDSTIAKTLIEAILASHPTLKLIFSYLFLAVLLGMWWAIKRWLRQWTKDYVTFAAPGKGRRPGRQSARRPGKADG